MDIKDLYNDPIISTMRKGDFEDPYNDITESLQVINSSRPLTEIPVRDYRVQISQNGTYLKEIEDGSPTENQFKVDYTQGVVNFHSSRSGQSFTFTYKGKGVHYYPASRVWTEDHGNGVVDTLDGLIGDTEAKLTEATTKLAEVETARINTINATADLNTTIEEAIEIPKQMVATYSAIATTYPTPQLGWTVVAQDSHIKYRWNGQAWLDIGVSDIGFNVVVGSTPPTSTQNIWVDAPESNRFTKVQQSSTPPTDTSAIWWETD